MPTINLPEIKSKTLLWANRPDASLASGELYYFSDIGPNGSYWISNGEFWSPLNGEVVLASSGVQTSVTGTTNETALLTYTVPGGLVSRIGNLDMTLLTSCTNSANSKTVRVRLSAVGSIAGTAYYTAAVTTITHAQFFTSIKANNATNSQKAFGATGGTIAALGATTAGLITSTLDMTQAQDIAVTGQLANTTEAVTLLGFTLVYRG